MVLYGTAFSESEARFLKENGLGLEVFQYANPVFADDFNSNHSTITEYMNGISGISMHGAYCDTYYTSIDPLIREVTKKRFLQSMQIASFHGINRVVFHSSYRKFLNGMSPAAVDTFVKSSVDFWRGMKEIIPAGMTLFIENVEDEDPEVLVRIFEEIGNPQICCCFDIGHAYFNGRDVSLNRWIDVLKNHIGHIHIHDNHCNHDQHLPLGKGSIPLPGAINKIIYTLGEDIPFVLECNIKESVKWLRDVGFDI